MKRCWGYGVLGGGVLLLCGLGGVLWGQGGEVLSVVVRAGAADPQPAGVGQVVRVALQGQVVNPPVRPSSACVVQGPYWSWWVEGVQYKASWGDCWGPAPVVPDYQLQVQGETATLVWTCPQGGYWQVVVGVQVVYNDPPCTDQWQAVGSTAVEVTAVGVTFWPQPVGTIVGLTVFLRGYVTPGEWASRLMFQVADPSIAELTGTAPADLQITGMAVGATEVQVRFPDGRIAATDPVYVDSGLDCGS